MTKDDKLKEEPVPLDPQQSLIIGTIVFCSSTNDAELHFITVTVLHGYVNRVDAYIMKFTGR